MALLALARPGQADAQDCRLVSMGEIPVSQGSDGRPMLGVALDGKPVQVALDFENAYSKISRAKAMELGVPVNPGGGGVFFLGKDSLNDAAELGTLRLGAASLSGFEAAVDEDRKAFDGIVLGYNMLKYFLPGFDLAHGVIRLWGKDHCADKMVYWAPEYLKFSFDDKSTLLMVPAKLDGRDIYATLAPEKAHSTISFDAADVLNFPHDGEGVLQSLEFGGIALHHISVGVADLRYAREPDSKIGHIQRRAMIRPTDLKIGDDVLKHLRFMIDFEAKTVYFTVG